MNIRLSIVLFSINLTGFLIVSTILGPVKRAITSNTKRLWDYAVIPYQISDNYGGWQKALFNRAMRHWSNYTCIKFVERTADDHPDYILFSEQKCGCCSYVGRKGNGEQIISIGRNCANFGTVVHELGHVIGFWHEHTRPDRDKHVNILTDNIVNGQEYNFVKMKDEDVDLLNSVYDYNSIMHYAKNTFSKGPYFNTIESIGKTEIGQRIHLSDGDIIQTNILYNCPKCGGTLQKNSGNFSSIDSNYCEWGIEATSGERIELNLTFNLGVVENCENSIEIRDGYWHKSPLIKKICNGNSTTIISNSYRLFIQYRSKHPETTSVSATYKFICEGDLFVTNESHLESPNYPEDYPGNLDCLWRITVAENHQIALIFESFEIEYHDECLYDFLEIYEKGNSLGKLCGSQIPPNFISNSNQIYVKFTSDYSLEKTGFSMKIYKEFDECGQETPHGCSQRCVNTLGSYRCSCEIGFELNPDGKSCEDTCGGLIDLSTVTTAKNTITSPLFPDLYPNNKTCIWEIRANLGYRIAINFTYFDLEGNNLSSIQSCEFDKLEIFEIHRNSVERSGVFCGSKIPKPVISAGNTLRLVFTSDGNLQKPGFEANYLAFKDECLLDNGGCEQICRPLLKSRMCDCRNGYNLANDGFTCSKGNCTFEIKSQLRGRIITPQFPHLYPPSSNCIWNITTTPGLKIRLIFRNFDLEKSQDDGCLFDKVEIFDGPASDSVTLGKFCGNQLPPILTSSGNQIYINFRSDATISGRGFRAKFTTI